MGNRIRNAIRCTFCLVVAVAALIETKPLVQAENWLGATMMFATASVFLFAFCYTLLPVPPND